MKKCASCTKDLPDAALHCVFCGAKQPPAQPVQPMAKTAFGYSASELQEQQRRGAQPAPGFPPPGAPPPSHQPLATQPTMMPAAPPPAQQPLATQPTMMPAPSPVLQPQRGPLAHAATQAVQAYPGPGPNHGGPSGAPGPGPSFSSGPARPGVGASGPGSFGPGFAPTTPGAPGPSYGAPSQGFGGAAAMPPHGSQGATLVPGQAFAPPSAQGFPGPQPGFSPAAQAGFPAPAQPGFPPPAQPGFPPPAQPGYPPQTPGFAPGQPAPGFVPASAAGAKTMFAPGPAPQGSFGPGAAAAPPPMAATLVPQPLQPMPLPTPVARAPAQPTPAPMAIPAAMPQPYHASQSLMQHRRPVDPWRDSLRAMLFIWGVLLLGAFATPLSTSPLTFSWNAILDGAGLARLPPLVLGAVGLLSVIVAIIPMPTAPRGVIAAVLGLAGILVPVLIVGVPPWQSLLMLAGEVMLVSGLIIRSEYRASMLPRVLVTLGALALLLPLFLPQNGALPVVGLFKAMIDLPGTAKLAPALLIGLVVIVVVALLVTWMPSPVEGGAKLWAWLVILWPLVTQITMLLLAGHLGDVLRASPHAALVSWIYGGAGPGGLLAIGAAYLVIIGYGLASALGKQLE